MTEDEKKESKNIFKKIKDFFEENEWSVGLFFLTIVAFILDTIGFKIMFEENGLNGFWHDYIYYSIRVFGFDLQTPSIDTSIPWVLELGRWLSAIVTIWAVMLAVAHIFRDKWTLFKKGKDHIVIIGAGSKGKTLGLDWIGEMTNLKHKDNGTLIVYIEKDKNNPNVDLLKGEGAVVIFGDAKDELILRKAKVHNAKYIVTLTDSDSTNMEIVSTLITMQKDMANQIACYIHLIHNEFYEFFMAQDFQNSTKLDIKIFNVNSNSARMLFGDKNNLLGSNILTSTKAIKDPNTKVKIAIFGFGELGESILLHALHLGHFYNETPIEVTVVYDEDKDENANLLDEFTKQYNIGIDKNKKTNTSFEEYWKIRFIDDGEFEKENISEYSQIVIAYEDEFESLSNLMKMLKKYNDEILSNNIDISIYSNSFVSTASVIKNDKKKDKEGNLQETIFKQVRTFGEIKETCSYAMIIDQQLDEKSKLNNEYYNKLHGHYNSLPTKELEQYQNELYNANMEFSDVIKKVATKAKDNNIEIVDYSGWNNLSMFLKDSNRYLMEHHNIKKYIIDKFIDESLKEYDYETTKNNIKSKYFYKHQKINWDEMGLKDHEYAVKLSEDEIVQLGKVEHNRWVAFHILNGWKKRDIPTGTKDKIEKDKVRKLHPCIVSWDELDRVSKNHNHDYKSDDIETIMRIPSLEKIMK